MKRFFRKSPKSWQNSIWLLKLRAFHKLLSFSRDLMIKDYKKIKVLEPPNDKCYLYFVQNTVKSQQCYMYELTEGDQFEQYFKFMNKFIGSHHILQVLDCFTIDKSLYYVTERPKPTLYKHQLSLSPEFFKLQQAMSIFSQILQGLLDLHKLGFVCLGIHPDMIKFVDGTAKLSNFSLSMRVSKAEKLTSLLGRIDEEIIPPEGFSKDKISLKSDYWMLGVTFYYMLNGEYPFKGYEDIKRKCEKEGGFDYKSEVQSTKFKNRASATHQVCDFFRWVFTVDPGARITQKGLKSFAQISKYFSEQTLSFIKEQKQDASAILSQIKDKNYTRFLDYLRLELDIIDFIERNSSYIYAQTMDMLTQEKRLALRYALLKLSLVKLNDAVDLMESQQAGLLKFKQEGVLLKEDYEKERKVIEMQFKAVNKQLQTQEKVAAGAKKILGQLYGEQLPTFADLKRSFRILTSAVFASQTANYRKVSASPELRKKRMQLLTKVVFFHLINRIFEEQHRMANLKLYFSWHKGKDIGAINNWIKEASQETLTEFIKFISEKYLYA